MASVSGITDNFSGKRMELDIGKRHIKPKSYYLKNFPVFIDP